MHLFSFRVYSNDSLYTSCIAAYHWLKHSSFSTVAREKTVYVTVDLSHVLTRFQSIKVVHLANAVWMQRKKYDWETVSENILCRAYSRSATDIILSKNNGSLLLHYASPWLWNQLPSSLREKGKGKNDWDVTVDLKIQMRSKATCLHYLDVKRHYR